MAVAGIIAAAVGVILLIIVAYIVVGGSISAAETVTSAQKDVTLRNEIRLGTAVLITDPVHSSANISSNITNAGTEIISDFTHMDVLVFDSVSNEYHICTYNPGETGSPGSWYIANRYQDFIHPFELDPGEKYRILVTTRGSSPEWFQITTGNGIYASAFV